MLPSINRENLHSVLEAKKYQEIWDREEYHQVSPGESLVQRFLMMSRVQELMERPRFTSIVDVGCGSGKGGLELTGHGFDVWYYDLVDVVADEVPKNRFKQGCLWQSEPQQVDIAYCCDVMEHIPPVYAMLAIHNILSCCKLAFFNISLIQDGCGMIIGKPLHLTVKPYTWWRDHIADMTNIYEAVDMIRSSIFLVEGYRYGE